MDLKYENSLIEIRTGKASKIVVCYRMLDSGDLLCFPVKNKKFKCAAPIALHTVDGEDTVYNICSECRFLVPIRYVHRYLFECMAYDLQKATEKHMALPSLQELELRYKELYECYHHTNDVRKLKELRKKLNQLSQEINDRKKSVFPSTSQNARMKRKDKFNNYRVVPNSEGITKVYHGGSCNGK